MPEKHKNIEINNDRGSITGLDAMISQAYKMLTASNDIEKQIDLLFKAISNLLMYDHLCIETPHGLRFENCHKLAYTQHFEHVDYNLLNDAIITTGVFSVKDMDTIKGLNRKFYDAFAVQKVCSTLLIKISVFDKDYGVIRIDSTNTNRVWQKDDTILFMSIAHYIALLLYYNDKTLG